MELKKMIKTTIKKLSHPTMIKITKMIQQKNQNIIIIKEIIIKSPLLKKGKIHLI